MSEERILAEEQENYETFRECVGEVVLRELGGMENAGGKGVKKKRVKKPVKKVREKTRLRPGDADFGKRDSMDESKAIEKGRKSSEGKEKDGRIEKEDKAREEQPEQSSDAEDLADFIDYLAALIFTSLPPDLRILSPPPTLDPATRKDQDEVQDLYSLPLSHETLNTLITPLPPDLTDTLSTSGLLHPTDPDLPSFLSPILTAYISSCTSSASPAHTRASKPPSCELCLRTQIPLTFHHLIPRSTHTKVLKRHWHPESALHQGAWVCRACHSFVHGLAGNEVLARKFYTLELIRGGGVDGDGDVRGEVEAWVRWVGGVRWKKR